MCSDLASLFFLLFFTSWSIIDNETILSFSAKLIPLIPFEDLPLNTLNFLDSNLIHFPSFVFSIISWSSLQILTPTILSSLSSFIAILPDALIDVKSSKLFFLIFPLLVANIICIFSLSTFSSGKGIIELMDWWFFKGNILNKDLPFDAAEPSGIFQALIL